LTKTKEHSAADKCILIKIRLDNNNNNNNKTDTNSSTSLSVSSDGSVLANANTKPEPTPNNDKQEETSHTKKIMSILNDRELQSRHMPIPNLTNSDTKAPPQLKPLAAPVAKAAKPKRIKLIKSKRDVPPPKITKSVNIRDSIAVMLREPKGRDG
jgi:hypothetical protein